MKRHLNLMSDRARIRVCIRTRIRQWSTALAVVLVLLIPLTLVLWWPVHCEGQLVEILEVQYQPIRQMREASQALRKRIELIRTREKTALSLAKADTPVVTLLGLIGKSVSESGGQAFVEALDFCQDTGALTAAEHDRPATVNIGGRGLDLEAVHRLTASLQSALPFASVQLKSSEDESINGQPMQRFLLECSL